MEEKKDLELAATNSRTSDETSSKISSVNNIPQDSAFLQPDWCFTNEEMNFGEYSSNCEKEELSIFQKALMRVKEKEKNMLQDNVICPCTFKYAELGYTSSSQIDILKLGFEVDDGTSSLKQVEDIYLLNDEYIDSTIERLRSVLSKFHYNLTNEDLRDLNTILTACNCLIGKTAKIKQYTKNDYKKYWFYTD